MAEVVATVAVDRERARVYEHGWQSWSPTTAYRLDERPFRPASDLRRVGNYRPERTAPDDAFWGEGSLAVDPGTGDGARLAATSASGPILSIRAEVAGGPHHGERRRRVPSPSSTREPISTPPSPGGPTAFAAAASVGPLRPPPTAWCSWYHYFERVTQDDIEENLRAIDDLGLDIDVVQIDDGYQAEIGDWLLLSDRFASLEDIVGRIRGAYSPCGHLGGTVPGGGAVGARPGAPRLAGRGRRTGTGWPDQRLASLDATHPGVEAYLREVFGTFGTWASTTSRSTSSMPAPWTSAGRGETSPASRPTGNGLRVIQEAIGPDAYLLGCGAPILPSVGLVDAMRVGPDIAHHYEPMDGDSRSPPSAAAQNSCGGRGSTGGSG